MKDKFNFDENETLCSQQFDKDATEEEELLSKLFNHLESLIIQLDGEIKDNQFPDWTIEITLAYNLTLLYNSFDRLRKGYLGISQSLLRPVIENIALSMYFFEFPDDEKKYKSDRKSFYMKLKSLGYVGTWIEPVLNRIDKEGSKFAKGDQKKGQSWYNFLFRNLAEEASNFLHTNPDYIYASLFKRGGEDLEEYALGPNYPRKDLAKAAIWKIIESTLLNTVVLDRCFKQLIKKNNPQLIGETVEKLNEWKKEYQSLSKKRE